MYISFFSHNATILITFWFQITCIPFLRQHYIPRPDRQLVYPIFCVYIIINFKTTCVKKKTWVKISKVMPQPKSISPGKGREALRQKVQISRLQYGTA